MSSALGVIKAVIGEVFAIAADGSKRLLQEGDRVYSGEEIVTGNTGAVSIGLANGKTVDIGRNSHWSEHGINTAEAVDHATQDVAAMQKALADGVDPTTALEATAAGNQPAVAVEGGGGGHTLVQLELTNKIVDATAGFNTGGIGAPIPGYDIAEGALGAGDGQHILPPEVSIDRFAGGDGFINKYEINHTDIEGTSNQTTVRLVFTDSQKNTIIVDVPVKDGHWVAHPDLTPLTDGKILVEAIATDVSGRTAQSFTSALIDTVAGHDEITVDSVTPDNVINIDESHQQKTMITGNVSGDAKIGDNVTLTVNGHDYNGVVVDLGGGKLGYQIPVPTPDLLNSPLIHATVTSIDEAGNVNQASIDHRVELDLYAHNEITINTVDSDDVVNRIESRMPLVITGDVGGDAKAGDPVTIMIGGREFHGEVISENNQLRYSVTVPTSVLNEGANDLSVKLVSHDPAGNESIATEHKTIVLDTEAHNALTINTVAGDDIVNRNESRMPTLVSGEVTGDAQVGDRVVVTVHDKMFYGTVVETNGKLTYEVAVPTSALIEGSNEVTVQITGVDAYDNNAIAIDHKTIVLDTQAHNALTINTVAGDDTVNRSESRMPTLIAGEVTGDSHAGDQVVVMVNGEAFYGTVSDENGKLTYEVPVPSDVLKEGRNEVTVQITGVDTAGNTAIAIDHKTVVLDTHAENGVDIRTVAGDDVVNYKESLHETLISGAVTGKDAHVGDRVVVTVQGQYFTGLVVDSGKGHLHYSIPVPTGVLKEGNNDVHVQVISHDKAGNEAIAEDHRTVVLDTAAHASITVESITPDNVLNHNELDAKQWVTGAVGGDARPGDLVELNIRGQSYKGIVQVMGDGSLGYKIEVPAHDFGDNKSTVNADLHFTASVTAHDKAGNEVVQVTEHVVHLDNMAYNAVDIRTVSDDNVVNFEESKQHTHITGVVGGKDAHVGDKVVVTVDGNHFYGHVVDGGNGQLHYDVAINSSVLKEGDNDVHVKVTSHDKAGNEVTAEDHKNVVFDPAAHATITVDNVTPDNVLNHNELDTAQWIEGKVGGDARRGDVVDLEINGKHFTGNVRVMNDGSLGYKIQVPEHAFDNNTHGNIDKSLTFTASVTSHDQAGNVVTETTIHTVGIDNHAENDVDIRIVAGDDVVNHDESQHRTHITGAVTGRDAHVGDKVVVTVHGHHFYGQVVDSGGGHLHYDVAINTGVLKDGGNEVYVKVTSHDKAGNEATAEDHKIVVLDTAAHASITVESITPDNVLNHNELDAKQWVTGAVGGDARPGDAVELNIGSQSYKGIVQVMGDGSLGYKIEVPAHAFGDNHATVNADLHFTASVTAHDKAGNEVVQVTEHVVHLDNMAYNAVDIRTVSDDNVVNFEESKHLTHITGVVGGKDAHVGDKVVVTVDGHQFNGRVVDSGNGHLHYDVAINSRVLKEGDNDVQVKVISHDKAGNEAIATASHNVVFDPAAHATITVDNVTRDNVLNHNELDTAQWIEGKVGLDARRGDVVDLEINGQHFTGNVRVMNDGSLGYKIQVPADIFDNNTHGNIDRNLTFTASVTSHDQAGNVVTKTTDHTLHIDNHAENGVTIGTVAGDDVVNYKESLHDTPIEGLVSGVDAQAGDKVTVTVQGQQFHGRVQSDGNGHLHYSIPVPSSLLKEGDNGVSVKVVSHDKAGNEAIAEDHKIVVLDTAAHASITVDDVTADNVLNHDELDAKQWITGTVGGDAKEHDRVELDINGHKYPGKVEVLSDGSLGYKIEVPANAFGDNHATINADLHFTASVTAHDSAGNEVVQVTEHVVHLDNMAYNAVDIRTVSGNDIINHDESLRDTPITGIVTGKDAHIGDKVVVTVQGQEFVGKVVDGGNGHLSYSVPVPTGVLKENDNDVQVKVISHDKAGNEAIAIAHHNVVLDTAAHATITVDNVTRDNVLNHDELDAKQWIEGKVGLDARRGDVVDLEINGQHFTGTVRVMNDGSLGYKIQVPANIFDNNTHGDIDKNLIIKASVTSHDLAGNVVTETVEHTVHIDNHAESTIHIDAVAGDDMVNKKESLEPTTRISGTVGDDAQAGDKVVVTVEGVQVHTRVVDDGHGHLQYSVLVPTKALHDGDNTVQVQVTSHDKAGNETVAYDQKTIVLDTKAEATITVDKVTADNILNHDELDAKQWVSGTVGGDAKEHDPVVLDINGHTFTGEVKMLSSGVLGYSIQVDANAFGTNQHGNQDVNVYFTASVTAHDKAGNEVTQIAHHTVHIDNHANNSVTIETTAGDNIVNHDESLHDTVISGVVTGHDAHGGDKVVVTVQGHHYDGVVSDDGHGNLTYSISVPKGGMHEGPNDVKVQVYSHDKPGNEAIAEIHQVVKVDTIATATITIDSVTADNVLNHDELATPMRLVSGTVGGDARVGDEVTLEINGQQFSGKVIDLGNHHLGYQIPVLSSAFSNNQGKIDTNVKFTAKVISHDDVNNEVVAKAEHTVHIDNHAEAQITVGGVTGDDTINHDESRDHETCVRGTVSGEDVHIGDKVIVEVNGHKYETTVIVLPHQGGALGYNVNVLTRDILADPLHRVTAHVVGHDSVGNHHLAEATKDLQVDLHADATITIDPVTPNKDDMINKDESQSPFTTVTGKVGGDAKAGDLVTLHINGVDYPGVVKPSMEYSIQVSTHDLMTDPNITATITVTDDANNTKTVSATDTVVVDTRVDAVITVDSVTPDNTLNADELKHGYSLVSGTVKGEMHVGDPLTLTINNHVYHGTVQDLGNNQMGYCIPVSTADIQAGNHIIHASIEVTDAAQNNRTATTDHLVNIDDHAEATITINIVSGDDVLNQADQAVPKTNINGVVTGDVQSGDYVHLTVNGHTYEVEVKPQQHLNGQLGYSYDVPTSDLLANPHIVATVDAKDAAGNTITASTTHDVHRDDGAQATITIDTVAIDDVINNDEAHQPKTTITGLVTGDVPDGSQVDLVVNGQHYYGYVHENNGLRYSIDVNTADLLSGSAHPKIHASVLGQDAAGNTVLAETDHVIGIDTRADGSITAIVETNTPVNPDYYIVRGDVGGDAKLHDIVKITVGNKTVETEVIKVGDHLGYIFERQWDPVTQSNIYLGLDEVAAHPDILVQITCTDPYGNTVLVEQHQHAQINGGGTPPGNPTGTTTPPVDHTPPHGTLTISPIAGDNVINKVESQEGKTIVRGTVAGDVQPGDIVTLHVGNQTYTGPIIERPNLPGEYGYEIKVDTNELMKNPDITAEVTAHNGNGSLPVSETSHVDVDTSATAKITLDPIAGDDVINIKESQSGTTTVSGTVSGDNIKVGSNVTLTVNGHQITAQVFEDANHQLRFSKDVSIDDLRRDHTITASVNGYDEHGNVTPATDGRTVTVDTDVSASVKIDDVTPDNVLNLAETKAQMTTVTGSVSGDVHPGEQVTLTVNGQTYHAVIKPDNHYSVDIQTSDIVAGKHIHATVTGHDAAQNSIDGETDKTVNIDTTAEGEITVNVVSGNDILSAADIANPKTEISGTVGKDARVGDDVSVTLNGVTTTEKVIALPNMNGQLGYILKVDTANLVAELKAHPNKPEIAVTVTGSDDAHNPFSATETHTITIDDHADVYMHVDNVAVDNVLNLVESQNPTTVISGSVSGDVRAGNYVVITVNGSDLNVPLVADANGGLTFSVAVNTSELLQDPNITYSVKGVDQVGNTVEHKETLTLTIDQDAENHITIDTVTRDDKVNYAEQHAGKVAITGTVSDDVHPGDTVTLEVNGHSYSGTVGGQPGALTYSIDVYTRDLNEGPNTVNVSVTGKDDAGNVAHSDATHTFVMDTHADATITLDPVTGDNTINKGEADHIVVTGAVGGDAKRGDVVSVVVNGHTLHTKVDGQGHYAIDVKKTWLHEGDNDITVSVQATDDAGNKVTPATYQNVVLDTHVNADITIATVAGDNVVNAAESEHLRISGDMTFDADAKLGDKVTLEINGHQIQTDVKIVNGHPTYDVGVQKDWLNEGSNEIKVSVDVTDQAGNHATATHTQKIFVDTHIGASLTIDPVAAHNVVNARAPEHISVTGLVGKDVHDGDTITINVNNHSVTEHVKMINGQLGYDAQIEKSWLHEGDNNLQVSVSTEDAAGNHRTVYQNEKILLDTHADARIHIDNLSTEKHATLHDVDRHTLHITGEIRGDVHKGEHVSMTVNGKHYDAILHESGGHLRYDIPVHTSDLHTGGNSGEIMVLARDGHGNVTPVIQPLNVMLSAPDHQGVQHYTLSDKPHDAGSVKGLHNLFADDHDTLNLSYSHDKKDDHGRHSDAADGKGHGHHGSADLTSLAHELHDQGDISQLIKGTDPHHGAGAVPPAPPVSIPAGHDTHVSPTYSLDHLIAKPEHYSH